MCQKQSLLRHQCSSMKSPDIQIITVNLQETASSISHNNFTEELSESKQTAPSFKKKTKTEGVLRSNKSVALMWKLSLTNKYIFWFIYQKKLNSIILSEKTYSRFLRHDKSHLSTQTTEPRTADPKLCCLVPGLKNILGEGIGPKWLDVLVSWQVYLLL